MDPVAPIGLDEVETTLDPVVDDPDRFPALTYIPCSDSVMCTRVSSRVGLDEDTGHVLGQMRTGLGDVETFERRRPGAVIWTTLPT